MADEKLPPTKGSDNWMRNIRKKAKELAHSVMMDYVELATTLWDIYDTPIHGDKNNPPIYTQWGYNKLGAFAAEELGLSPRKTDYLKSIGFMIRVTLKDSDPEWIERLLQLGWSKVRELSRAVEAHQLQEWVLQAEQASYKEIEKMVVTFLADKQKATEERAAATTGYSISKDPFAPLPNEAYTTSGVDGNDVNIAVSGAEFSSAIAVPPTVEALIPMPGVPIPERIINESFGFYEEQHKVVKQALIKAGELSGSTKKSNNMSLICADFLASNDFSTANEEQRLKFVAKLEQLLGYKFVVANADDYSIAYGIDNLRKIAAFQVNQHAQVQEEAVVCSR